MQGPIDDARARRAALVGLAWCAVVTLAGGTVWAHPAIAALLVMSPLITCVFAGARTTGGVGAVAVIMALTLAWPSRVDGATGVGLLIASVVLAAVAATIIAFLRQRSDERLAEARQREEGERQQRLALESRARAAVLTAGLATADDPTEVAEVVFTAAREGVGADAGLLSLLTERDSLRATAQFGYPEGIIERWGDVALTPDQPATAVVERAEPIWAESLDEFFGRWQAVDSAGTPHPHRSMAVLPLQGAGGPMGTLAFSFADQREFTPRLRTLLTALGEETARALERSRMAAINAEDAATAIRLERLSAALLGAVTPVDVARATVLKGITAVDAASGVVRVPSEERDRLECLWIEGTDSPTAREAAPMTGTPAGHVLVTGQPLWFESGAEAERQYPILAGMTTDWPPGRMTYLPLRARDEVVGVLAFGFRDAGPFAVADERLLEALADQCASALDRAQLFSRESAARGDAERARERLRLLSDVTRLLISSLDPDAVIERLVDLVTERFANACVVMLPGENGLHRALASGDDPDEEMARAVSDDPDVPFDSDAPAAVAYRTGLPQMVHVTEDVRARARRIGAPAEPEGSVTALAVPLPARGGTLGVMTFMGGQGRAGFDPDEIAIAVEVAARAGLALDNARRYAHEHDVAETLQRAVLPRRLPSLPGLSLSAEYRPGVAGTSAGGDWYDTVVLADGRVYFSVGDVMGKGTAAAALMGQVRAALRAYVALDPSPAAVLDRMDDLFDTLDEHRLVTAVVGTVDPATGEVQLASAGHPAPVVVDGGGGVTLVEGGGSLVLGTGLLRRGEDVRRRREYRFMLSVGDTLVLFSDGLLERRGEHISIGFDRLAEAVAEMRAQPTAGSRAPAARLVDLLSEDNAMEDDVVVLTIHLRASGDAAAAANGAAAADVSDSTEAGMTWGGTVGVSARDHRVAAGALAAAVGGIGEDDREQGPGQLVANVGEATREAVLEDTSLRLPPLISSTPTARHWVTRHLIDLPPDVVDTAVLLTSELVTNAVLHAETPLVLAIHRLPDRVRIDVSDGDPAYPATRAYGVDATTGRGLMLLDLLPSDWGVHEVPGGKVVWFELPVNAPLDAPGHASAEHRLESRLPLSPHPDRFDASDTFVLRLLGTPVALMQRATGHYEALFREFRLITERDPEDTQAVPRRLLELIGALGTQFSGFGVPSSRQWRAAVESGAPRVDLQMRMPLQTAQACDDYNRLLDEADEHCRAAELITLPTDPGCVALRRWVLSETARQAAGLSPLPFSDEQSPSLPADATA